jgi:hypothetical protein
LELNPKDFDANFEIAALFEQIEPAFVLFFKQSTPPGRLFLKHLLHALVAESITSVADPSSHSLLQNITGARDDSNKFDRILEPKAVLNVLCCIENTNRTS